MRKLLRAVVALLLSLIAAWISLAIAYSPVLPDAARAPLATLSLFAASLGIVGQIFIPSRLLRIVGLIWLLGAGIFSVAYLSLRPSHDKKWAADVARLPWVEHSGDIFRIHDVRDFKYRSEKDFDARYVIREFDINELSRVDLITSHWGSDHIAHIMISFGFSNGEFLTFSLETRKESNESYSALAGFFRNYELIAVAAQERDIITLRTDVRQPNEDVYLWQIDIAPHKARIFLLRYIKLIERLQKKPEFYSSATTNCTTGVLNLAEGLDANLIYSWKILLSGHSASFLYDIGSLDRSVPFSELKARSRINEKAHAAFGRDDFSRIIRQ
jgi:hypothetical protein